MKATVAEAIAYALIDLGVDVVTHVPGYGASQTFKILNEIEQKNNKFSFNEETAYTISHGASIAGKRSACLIKAHGFLKAGNSVGDSLYTELTAGFVTIVFEDLTGKHSDNIMQMVPLLKGMYFPFVSSFPQTIYLDVIKCFKKSEERKMPYVLLVNSADADQEVVFERENAKDFFVYERNILKHVVSPLFAEYQYKVLSAKKLEGDISAIEKPVVSTVPECFPEHLKEEGSKYIPFFDVFKGIPRDFASGDTSLSSYYSLPPFNSIDAVTHIGGSIPLAIGAYSAGMRNTWALTGDFGFLAAGHIALPEVIQREIPLKIVIFYNKIAAATGGQPIPKKLMLRILAGYEHFIVHITDPSDYFEIGNVLNEVANADELKIIIVDY